jgi:integrase
LKLVRQVLGFAVEKGRIPFNPADVLRGRGALPPQKRTTDVRPLDPEQVEAIRVAMLRRRSAHGLRDATLVSLLAYAGLRPEEALALRWSNVAKTSIRVEHANANGEIKQTKTAERRTVRPLIAPLVADLDLWRSASIGEFVIPGDEGEPWDAWKYANWRARTFKACAPPWATPYSCRHGFASLLIREGRTLADVARLMGHSPTMTTQHYLHWFEQYQWQPSKPMEALVTAARSVRKVSDDSAAGRKTA